MDSQITEGVAVFLLMGALDYLAVSIRKLLWAVRENWENEKSSKKLAILQGELAGYEKFLDLASEQMILGGNAFDPPALHTLSDIELGRMLTEFSTLEASEAWKHLLFAISLERARMAHDLLDFGEGGRDIVVARAKLSAMRVYEKIIAAVRDEGRRRAAARAAEAEQPVLFPAATPQDEKTVRELMRGEMPKDGDRLSTLPAPDPTAEEDEA